jgi:hypothetical protein
MSYLDEAADILRKALESAENRYSNLMSRRMDGDRRELLEARVRIAEGFARLHEAERAGGAAAPKGQDPEDLP